MKTKPDFDDADLSRKFSAQKEYYQASAQQYRRALEDDFDDLKTEAAGYARKAALVSGIGVASVWLLKRLIGSRKKRRPQPSPTKKAVTAPAPSVAMTAPPYRATSPWIIFVRGIVASVLVAVARDKIGTFIDQITESNSANESARPYSTKPPAGASTDAQGPGPAH